MKRTRARVAPEAGVESGAPPARAGDEVEGTSAAFIPSPATAAAAVRCLYDRFGTVLEAEYIPGKTELRDALSASLRISQLAAEDLCDALERAGGIGFIRTGEGYGWHIHAEGDRAIFPGTRT